MDMFSICSAFNLLHGTSAHGYAGCDIANEILGGDDVDLHYRFEHNRRGFGAGMVKGRTRHRFEGELGGCFGIVYLADISFIAMSMQG